MPATDTSAPAANLTDIHNDGVRSSTSAAGNLHGRMGVCSWNLAADVLPECENGNRLPFANRKDKP